MWPSMFVIVAIPAPPRLLTVTTHSVLLEFQAANESVSHYEVEYAQDHQGAPSAYRSTVTVRPQEGQVYYRVTQDYLIPGGYFLIRIVPFTGSNTRGIPSEDLQVGIPKPGM